MEIRLSRRGGPPLREQIATQLGLRILDGSLLPGQRLPSVRALARRLRVHSNTVSQAYQDLEGAGHVLLRRGSGVFVREAGPLAPQEARELDEMIRLALLLALRKGFGADQIRGAVRRWLAAKPPERVVVVDPAPELARLLVHELREGLARPVVGCSLDEAAADPRRLLGALAVVLPYQLRAFRERLPSAAVEVVNPEAPEEETRALRALPAGSIVLAVASSPTLLPFAEVLFKGLRGDELHVETRALADTKGWRRLVAAADLVLADGVAAPALAKLAPRRLRVVRVVSQASLRRLEDSLSVVVPR
jgi:GntR family transcriptional regulator